MKKWQDWKASEKLRQRDLERRKKQRNNDESELVGLSEDPWDNFDPNQIIPEFSFAGRSYDVETLEKDLELLHHRSSTPKWAIQAIRRGIAVHHSGMNKKYRDIVER